MTHKDVSEYGHLDFTPATGSILVDGRVHRTTIGKWDPTGENPDHFAFISRSTMTPIVAEIEPDAPMESARRLGSRMDKVGSINLRGGSVSAKALGMGFYKAYRYKGVRAFLENAEVCSGLSSREIELIYNGLAAFYGWSDTDR